VRWEPIEEKTPDSGKKGSFGGFGRVLGVQPGPARDFGAESAGFGAGGAAGGHVTGGNEVFGPKRRYRWGRPAGGGAGGRLGEGREGTWKNGHEKFRKMKN